MTKSLLTLALISILSSCGPVVETTTEPEVIEETAPVDSTTEASTPVDSVSAQ